MSTTPYAIIAGPADVWVHATAGTAAQLVDAVDATRTGAGWVNLGQTEGGVKVKHTQTVDLLKADQRTGPVKAIRSEEGLEVTFNAQENTLALMSYFLNNNSITTALTPARSILKLYQGLDVHQFALMVRGPSPYMNANLQYYVPVVVQTEEPELEFVRDGKAVSAFKWVALEDPSAATSADRFGQLTAQTS